MKCATQHKFYSVIKAGNIQKIILLLLLHLVQQSNAQQLLEYVQPMNGTAASTTASSLKHSIAGSTEQNANTIPSVTLPFAMTQWVPQTRETEHKCVPPYLYRDSLLSGFRGTHWISGSCMQDYGSVTVVPVVGSFRLRNYAVTFFHVEEKAAPDYYSVSAGHVLTEITATLRCSVIRFTMQRNDSLYLLAIPNSDYEKGFIKIDAANNVIYGYNPVYRIYQGWGQSAGFNGWFYMKIERAFVKHGAFSDGKTVVGDSIINQKSIGAYAGFKLKKGEQLVIKIGTSFSSLEGAKENLEKEIGIKNFESVRKEANDIWERALAKIKIETKDETAKKVFYTALYHTMQQPRLYNDVNGNYPKFAAHNQLMNTNGRNYYDDFSMWDIYRAELPLYEIVDTKLTNDLVQSLVWKGEQGGWLPIFPCWNNYTAAMIGDHATAFIASAYQKGIRQYDVSKAYTLMRQNAFEKPDLTVYKNGMGRRALESYMRYGYIPLEDSVQEAFHKKEQVSRTLEYAFDDYALSVVAKGLNQLDDYKKLKQRSFYYENVFDTTVKMVRGKYANGNWSVVFHPDQRELYITEGTPRQYSFYVPQDVQGLMRLMGGKKSLEHALDRLFEKDEYWHGNEPGHQIPFMYNYTDAPWKTQQRVRTILKEEYSDGPGGLSGNDDAGQMSAWYVFASMGFYPLDPVSGEYQLCSPLFDNISISLPSNKVFRVVCHKSSVQDCYISKVEMNGKKYNKYDITYGDIINGSRIDIWLQSTPIKRSK
ncbi:MAG: GH92 family glycosyl hydrolase [Bacteroidota bacterium]|nr:GH92 family glycosyl hydrolase [Bacteroidota bacterium]